MWNNPIYRKEVKVNARSRRLSISVFFFNLFLAVIFLFLYYIIFSSGIANLRADASDILFLYAAITCIESCMLWFLVPSFTIGAISGECEKQTLEILLTTNLRSMQIVWGKLCSSLSHLLLLIVSGMPVLALVFSVGGIALSDLLQFHFLLFITGFFLESVGIYFSARFKRTAKAAAYTYGSVFFLLFGTILIVWLVYQITGQAEGSRMAYLLLLNPGFAYIALLTQQYGYFGEFQFIMNQFGGGSSFVLEHWYWISILVQLVLSVLFMLAAARCLRPNMQIQKISKK